MRSRQMSLRKPWMTGGSTPRSQIARAHFMISLLRATVLQKGFLAHAGRVFQSRFGGMLIVATLYIPLDVMYFHVLPFSRVARSEHVASDAVQVLFGRPLADAGHAHFGVGHASCGDRGSAAASGSRICKTAPTATAHR